jgi:hypothetical protein
MGVARWLGGPDAVEHAELGAVSLEEARERPFAGDARPERATWQLRQVLDASDQLAASGRFHRRDCLLCRV